MNQRFALALTDVTTIATLLVPVTARAAAPKLSSREAFTGQWPHAVVDRPVAAAKAVRDDCSRPNTAPHAGQYRWVNYSNLDIAKDAAVRTEVPVPAGDRT